MSEKLNKELPAEQPNKRERIPTNFMDCFYVVLTDDSGKPIEIISRGFDTREGATDILTEKEMLDGRYLVLNGHEVKDELFATAMKKINPEDLGSEKDPGIVGSIPHREGERLIDDMHNAGRVRKVGDELMIFPGASKRREQEMERIERNRVQYSTVIEVGSIPDEHGNNFSYRGEKYQQLEQIPLNPGIYLLKGGSGTIPFKVEKDGKFYIPQDWMAVDDLWGEYEQLGKK